MNATTEIEKAPGTDLVLNGVLTPAIVFAPGGVDAILKRITDEVRTFKADISTANGRKAIASIAHKVARSKTALDEMGKDLVAEWKKKAATIDAERRTIRDRLDALKDEVRKPLTDWEDAEKARIYAHEDALASIEAMAVFNGEPSLAEIDRRLADLEAMPKREWQEFGERYTDSSIAVTAKLKALRDAAAKREAERAELARLRAEQVAREAKERDERIAAEAAERARRDAEAKADAERQRIERERIAAEERAAKAEAAVKAAVERAERDRLAAIEAERKRAAAEKAADEAAASKREANKRHVSKINNEIKAAFITAGLSETDAITATSAIARSEVPHVKITY
jgi:septal ring factor EnvC (AmiA/AmiB activator)